MKLLVNLTFDQDFEGTIYSIPHSQFIAICFDFPLQVQSSTLSPLLYDCYHWLSNLNLFNYPFPDTQKELTNAALIFAEQIFADRGLNLKVFAELIFADAWMRKLLRH